MNIAALKRQLAALLMLGALGVGPATHANEAAPLADDPVAEKRLLAISEELRCLVCQNESLAGSRADLANDLRREIRDMIHAGRSDTEIMDFLVSRYGDFVRYRPPVKPTTWLLWGGPFVLLLGGIAGLFIFLRRRTQVQADPALSADEQRQAEQLLTALSTPSITKESKRDSDTASQADMNATGSTTTDTPRS